MNSKTKAIIGIIFLVFVLFEIMLTYTIKISTNPDEKIMVDKNRPAVLLFGFSSPSTQKAEVEITIPNELSAKWVLKSFESIYSINGTGWQAKNLVINSDGVRGIIIITPNNNMAINNLKRGECRVYTVNIGVKGVSRLSYSKKIEVVYVYDTFLDDVFSEFLYVQDMDAVRNNFCQVWS